MSNKKTDLVVIQPSSFCNIDCKYCYVPNRTNRSTINLEILKDILTKVFQSDCVADDFRLVWHNGEPLSLGLEFYQQVIDIINNINKSNKRFRHCIQTNGTLINQRWAEFFSRNNILPSVSIDGPKYIHDTNRVTKDGKGSFDAVIRGIRILKDNGIKLAGLCVITARSLDHGTELFQFFLNEGFSSLGLIIEEAWGGNPSTSFTELAYNISEKPLEERFQSFISSFFDAWLPHQDKIDVREFNDIFTALKNIKLGNSSFTKQEDASPCRVLSFNQEGGITTFSPQMIAGTIEAPNKFIVANIRDIETLDDLKTLLTHQSLECEIEKGIQQCRSKCGYFQLCGGGAPASKFYEHGTFNCTETRECRFFKQILTQVILDKMLQLNQIKKAAI
ncbi:GRRM system radical SAM/SPASM domain protein [Nostoc linckia FACHB-104]|nr:GRRM system radical SAM/SPASM domain protein [Nostoc linckia FACHB-104]